MVKKVSKKKIMTLPKKTNPMKQPIKCSLCGLEFKTKKAFVAHRRVDKDGGLACYTTRQLLNQGVKRNLDGVWG